MKKIYLIALLLLMVFSFGFSPYLKNRRKAFRTGGNDEYTKLLLHMDGVDESTTFTDSSASVHTATASGDAQIDTAIKKFGTASGIFDGTTDFIYTDSSADFNFNAAAAWTIDCWWQTSDKDRLDQAVFAGTSDYKYGIHYNDVGNNKFAILLSSNGSSWDIGTPTNYGTKDDYAASTWYHLALVFDGSTYKFYVDGTLDNTLTTSTTTVDADIGIRVGKWGDEGFPSLFAGNIDEFRISKGIARWTANFTPPNAPYN